jgi:hypothetical protein
MKTNVTKKVFASLNSLKSWKPYHIVDRDVVFVRDEKLYLYYGKNEKGWSLICTAFFDVTKEKVIAS